MAIDEAQIIQFLEEKAADINLRDVRLCVENSAIKPCSIYIFSDGKTEHTEAGFGGTFEEAKKHLLERRARGKAVAR